MDSKNSQCTQCKKLDESCATAEMNRKKSESNEAILHNMERIKRKFTGAEHGLGRPPKAKVRSVKEMKKVSSHVVAPRESTPKIESVTANQPVLICSCKNKIHSVIFYLCEKCLSCQQISCNAQNPKEKLLSVLFCEKCLTFNENVQRLCSNS